MTKIKICGITNYEDARNAVDLGADFLGFNFCKKSPRYVGCKKACSIIKSIIKKSTKAKIFGVFVNEKTEKIAEIADYCSLDFIQLSGQEDLDFVNLLKKSTDKKIIKVFRIGKKIPSLRRNFFVNNVDYFMLDTFKNGLYGGTGKTFNLNIAKHIDNKKMFLAGGLNERNVSAAIKKLNPFAVDVCSSIEKSAGIKDFGKMKKFIGAVKGIKGDF